MARRPVGTTGTGPDGSGGLVLPAGTPDAATMQIAAVRRAVED